MAWPLRLEFAGDGQPGVENNEDDPLVAADVISET
jgi:hypothetical protein